MGAFNSLADFLAMGGHGLYVWTAYAIGAAVIGFNILSPLRLRQKLITEHQRRLRREKQ